MSQKNILSKYEKSIARGVYNYNSLSDKVECTLSAASNLYAASQTLEALKSKSKVSEELKKLCESADLLAKLIISSHSDALPEYQREQLLEKARVYKPKFLKHLTGSEKKEAEEHAENLKNSKNIGSVIRHLNVLNFYEREGFAAAHHGDEETVEGDSLVRDLNRMESLNEKRFARKLVEDYYGFLSSFDSKLSNKLLSSDDRANNREVIMNSGIRDLSCMQYMKD
jgi:hypothetical protein